jgi:hypothetical protein
MPHPRRNTRWGAVKRPSTGGHGRGQDRSRGHPEHPQCPHDSQRPHVAQNTTGRRSAIDGRTTRHAGYAVSQRLRKRIEEAFGWIKTVAGQEKTRFQGLARAGLAFTFAAAAHNLICLPRLLEPPP